MIISLGVLILLSIHAIHCQDAIYQEIINNYDDPRVPKTATHKHLSNDEFHDLDKEKSGPVNKKEDEHMKGIKENPENDMYGVDISSTNVQSLHQCKSKLKKVEQERGRSFVTAITECRKVWVPYFKQLFRIFSQALETSPDKNILSAKITFTKEQFSEMQAILDDDDRNVKDLLDLFRQYNIFQPLGSVMYEKERFMSITDYTYLIGGVFAVAAILLTFMMLRPLIMNEINWRRQLILVIFVAFLFSIPWEWYRMYRLALSNKARIVMKDIPEECFPENMTVWKRVSFFFHSTFSLTDDKCKEYHDSLMVDPKFEVSPLQATSAALSRFLFEPIKYLSAALAQSFRTFFREIPVQWQPIIMIAIIILAFLVIISVTGFRVELPFIRFVVNNREAVQYVKANEPPGVVNEGASIPCIDNIREVVNNGNAATSKERAPNEIQEVSASTIRVTNSLQRPYGAIKTFQDGCIEEIEHQVDNPENSLHRANPLKEDTKSGRRNYNSGKRPVENVEREHCIQKMIRPPQNVLPVQEQADNVHSTTYFHSNIKSEVNTTYQNSCMREDPLVNESTVESLCETIESSDFCLSQIVPLSNADSSITELPCISQHCSPSFHTSQNIISSDSTSNVDDH